VWHNVISLSFLFEFFLTKAKLSKDFKVSGIPTLVFLEGQTGNICTKDGRSLILDDPEGLDFPWKPKTFGDIMSGCTLKDKDKELKWDGIDNDTIIGMYYSAHWVSGI